MTNFTVFLDIKKAFDTIDHNILLTKLSYYGISDEDLQLFESYLCDHRQCCNINGHVSSFQTIKYGVPQGSILGPLLSILYMNDLLSCLSNRHMTMYADDTSSSKAVRTLDEIREYVIPSLQKISDWLKANKLSLNAVKTEFMISGSYQRIKTFDGLIAIRVDGHLITRTNWTKYLGIIVDDNLSWELQFDHVSKKINKNIGVMKHIKSCVPKESLIMVYRTLVEPYFRYCKSVWGNCGQTLLNKLQALQNRAARVVNGVSFDEAEKNSLLKSLGWLNIRQLIYYDSALLMFKVSRGIAPESPQDLFEKCNNIHSYGTRAISSGNFYIPKMRTSKGQSSFVYSGASVWNEQKKPVKQAQSIDSFKEKLKEYLQNNHKFIQ